MRRPAIFFIAVICCALSCLGQKVTIRAVDQPAASVFRTIMGQTGKNFIYSSEILKDMRVNIDVKNKPLNKALDAIFKNTGISYRIKGNNVILKKEKQAAPAPTPKVAAHKERKHDQVIHSPLKTMELDEVVIVSRLESPAVETAEIGASKITGEQVRNTPVVFGESDVIKTLQLQPGVTEGTEGMAGMYVHGGNSDENLFMLDNVPLYQVNHFAGLFSAFNTDIIRYIDFFKTSIPAKYDGRLSSFMDVRLQNGNKDGHHGSARLGLTSGALNISGPVGSKTTYLAGVRRSWYDVLTIPVMAMINSGSSEQTRFRYYFMDLNAKVSHSFTPSLNGFVSAYYGNDLLKTGSEDKPQYDSQWYYKDRYDFNWGNLVVQTGLNYRVKPHLTAEFTAAYTRFFSTMKIDEFNKYVENDIETLTHINCRSDNNINDWIFRGDFDWNATDDSRVRFGANYVRHSFLPARNSREYTFNDTKNLTRDSTWAYRANEFNVYIEDDWKVSSRFRIGAGLHASLFNIDGKTRYGLSPRLSMSYRPGENFAIKGAYSRTVQYVHQLTESYLALPTDQWIPITGSFKPQTADKIAAGGYWQSADGMFAASVEGYYKFMHNLIDYCDEYYLKPPLEMWNARLTTGSGRAKGIDFKLEKTIGKFTGHIGYSLAWADRLFKDKNGGHRFPARFDNRHTINIVMNWNINSKVTLNAAWTGHSGNRFTLLTQMYEAPDLGYFMFGGSDAVPLKSSINNYQLPFYHRLDLSCTVKRSHGFWNFSLYNAYCHLNTVAIRRNYRETIEVLPSGIYYYSKPVFQKVKLLPIIPSISYTWQF